jgi:hypothetical protein
MIPKKDASITKGIIFAGCSYTWGQGLYYYSNLTTLRDQNNPWGYYNIYTVPHHRFRESVRYPRLVAKHFNTFEWVHPQNGGANDQIVNYWKSCFINREPGHMVRGSEPESYDQIEAIEYEEVSCVVFQLTQWMRDLFKCEVDGEVIEIPIQWYWENNPNRDRLYKDIYEKYLNDNNLVHGEMNGELMVKGLNNVKEFLMECESKGIKTYILAWPHEFIQWIEKDDWLCERWITFNYNEKNYKCIEHMNLDNPEFEIYKDYENFKIPPQDSHPSLKCHRVIADNIIEFIENKKS